MLRKYIKILMFVSLPCLVGIMPADAKVRYGKNMECILEDNGNDEYWFCGTQSKPSCDGVAVWSQNTDHWYSHGQKFSVSGAQYWCCAKDGYDANGNKLTYLGTDKGRIKSGSNWIIDSKTITKQCPGGATCTWSQEINICGIVDNPEDGERCCDNAKCGDGLILRNNVCVAPCDENANMAFTSEALNTCVSCETTKTQGIVNHICVKCDERTEVFEIEKNGCVKKTSKWLAQTTFFDKCWLCYTPEGLRQCLKNVSEGKSIPAECELGYKPDASDSK